MTLFNIEGFRHFGMYATILLLLVEDVFVLDSLKQNLISHKDKMKTQTTKTANYTAKTKEMYQVNPGSSHLLS